MKQIRHLVSLILLVYFSFLAETVFAEATTFNFSGAVTSLSGTPFGLSSAVGEPVTGSITYDTSLSPANNTGSVAGYIQPPPSGMSVVLGGITLRSTGNASLQVINDYSLTVGSPCGFFNGPIDNINGFFMPISVNQSPQANSGFIGFSLNDFTQTALSGVDLPNALDLLTFSERVGCIVELGSDGLALGKVFFSIAPPVPPAIAVKIDIKPGTFPNSINVRNQGIVPVAILTTGASDNFAIFDATTVNPDTVRFGATGSEAIPVSNALEDVDNDGDIDLILHFNTQDTGIKCGNTSATLTGSTFDDQTIKGTDAIKTIGCR